MDHKPHTPTATASAQKAAGEAAQKTSAGQQLLHAFAGLTSVLAGGVTAWREVLSESYSNFTSLDLVDDLKQKFRANFGPGHVNKLRGGMDAAKSADIIVEQNAKYQAAVHQRMIDAGFGSFSKRLELLNSHEKWKIGLTSLAVTGVSLGSLLLLTRDWMQSPTKTSEDDARQGSFAEAEHHRGEESPAHSRT